MGVKPATGGIILHSKKLNPTIYQKRKVCVSGAKETKNRGQTLQLLEAVWASKLCQCAIPRLTQRAKVQPMKREPSSPIPLPPRQYVSIIDEEVTNNQEGWQITTGRKILTPEVTFPSLG